MGSLNNKIIKLTAKKFNKKRAKLLPTELVCKLLRKVGLASNTYEDLFTVINWWYYHNSFKEKTILQVATIDTDFEEALLVASDIQIGTQIYEIDVRDIQQPDGNRPYWQVSGIMNVEFQ